jgi:hypothetical protein
MAMLAWISIGTAVWHFAVLVPDRFAGGIIGAFVTANLGAVVSGLLWARGAIPGPAAISIADPLAALPGSLASLAASYSWGARAARERAPEPRREVR